MEVLSRKQIPLVVIVGPTASGKTKLAIDIAKKFNGEIICADSRTLYKGMDIATAKPSAKEQDGVPHWGLGIVDADTKFSVVDFKKYADEKIKEIKSRGHIPFIVGGTGLYVDSVIFDYNFGKPVDHKLRSELQHHNLDELYEYCRVHNINLPENYKNKRYIIRNIENAGAKVDDKKQLKYKSIVVGITTDNNAHRTIIQSRIEQQLENGVIDEAIMMSDKYGWHHESMKSNIYRIIKQYIDGDIVFGDIKNRSATADWRLAKRQITWLKRNPFIQWMSLSDANNYLSEQLAIYYK